MNSIKRITCKNCKAHILGDRSFCSVCLDPVSRGLLSAEWIFIGFMLLWAVAIAYWIKLTLQ
jgi:RNA polymerase subunit RPABC4/transcription elongation factor Spt4